MQLNALIQVLDYLKKMSSNPTLSEGYKKISEIAGKTTKSSDINTTQEIIKTKAQLQQFLMENDPSDLGYSAFRLFEKMNYMYLFGKAASDHLDNLVDIRSMDFQEISSECGKRVKILSKVSDNINKLLQLFEMVFPVDIFQSGENSGKSNLILFFEGNLSISSIFHLERYAKLWDGIFGDFSKLTGEERLNLDISSFRNGDAVLGVAATDNTLNAIVSGIEGITSILPDILRISKIQTELTSLDLKQNIGLLLEDEKKSIINKAGLEVAQKLTARFPGKAHEMDELTESLARSVKQILSFILKGGKIEINPVLSTDEISKTKKALAETYLVVRELNELASFSTGSLRSTEV
jgi:hypothetical protein